MAKMFTFITKPNGLLLEAKNLKKKEEKAGCIFRVKVRVLP